MSTCAGRSARGLAHACGTEAICGRRRASTLLLADRGETSAEVEKRHPVIGLDESYESRRTAIRRLARVRAMIAALQSDSGSCSSAPLRRPRLPHDRQRSRGSSAARRGHTPRRSPRGQRRDDRRYIGNTDRGCSSALIDRSRDWEAGMTFSGVPPSPASKAGEDVPPRSRNIHSAVEFPQLADRRRRRDLARASRSRGTRIGVPLSQF